jgi:hypothetical protein
MFVGFQLLPASDQTLVYEALLNRTRSLDRPTHVLADPVEPRGPGEIIAGIAEYRFQSTDFFHEVDDFGSADVNLVAESEYSEVFTSEAPCGPGWADFTDQYGADQLYRFSDVGLSEDATRAVVYVEYEIDCFRGASFVRFEKDGSWRYVETERVWVESPPEI